MESKPSFKLVVQAGLDPGQEFLLTQPKTIIGRDLRQGADIVLASPVVSRVHATIVRSGDRWTIQDQGSSNGTFVNGEKVGSDPRPLNSGDQIRLGQAIQLVFTGSAVPVAPAASAGAQAESVATMLADDLELPELTTPPELTVITAGGSTEVYKLTEDAYTLGRSPDNEIVIGSKFVSRQHAKLERMDGGYSFINLPETTNPVHYEGRPVGGPHRLRHNDILRIGATDPGEMVTLIYNSPDEAGRIKETLPVRFGEKDLLQFGRDASNDVVLDSPTVSRFHAQIERIGQRFRVRDLRSSNGTFVNDERVVADVWVKPQDTVRIGAHRFVVGEDQLSRYDDTGGLRADGIGLNKWVRKDLNILQNISVSFQPREFIVIVGQSGGGKSTLLDAIAGYRPATHGRVLVNDIDVYKNFDAIRSNIGYVPQRDIIHHELTAYEALDYSAQLRMPPDTTKEERHRRVMEVLQDLDLAHRKDVQVRGLSGGQQKRVSIGVELLTQPGLFFLDEATSGLDPGTETALMHLMRRLADQGRTILLVTHATKNVMLADKVLFMARGGYVAWFGPPDEALEYFDQFRPERDRRTRPMEFDQIYSILEQAEFGSPADWHQRFMEHPAYQKHIADPLYSKHQVNTTNLPTPQAPAAPVKKPEPRRQVSSLRQFLILSARNLKILARDRVSVVLMLAAAPIVSMLDVLIAFLVGSNLFDFTEGSIEDIFMSFFILIIFGAFVGGLSQMREIVKENEIYKRERLVNLKVVPYVFSKVWIAAGLALFHAAAYISIHYLAYDMPGGVTEFALFYVTMALLAMAGMMLGLFTSALAPTANTAPMIVILLILPQIVLSSALVPLPGPVSAPAATRWAFEGFMAISGIGSDVAADACWALPEELRNEMDIETRTERCACMGTNALNSESCSFPGLGRFYNEVLEEERPVEPAALRDPPPEPVLPDAPAEPTDQSDSIAMAEYFEALQVYQDEAAQIQSAYEAEISVYQAEADVYQNQIVAYQEDLLGWQISRAQAVEPAEAVLDKVYRDYGWTFVNKNDTVAFYTKILTTWIAQLVIIAVLVTGVLIMVKRKDVV